MIDDVELKGLIAAGNVPRTYDLIHRAYQDDVRRLVRLVARNPSRIDDVCQDVWKGVGEALGSFRFECASRVWVLAIARRRAIDVHRRPAREITLDSQIASGGAFGAALGLRTYPTPSRELRAAETGHLMRDVLAALSPDDREILELRYVVGLKPAQIVTVLARRESPNALSQRIVRLVRKLRTELSSRGARESFGT